MLTFILTSRCCIMFELCSYVLVDTNSEGKHWLKICPSDKNIGQHLCFCCVLYKNHNIVSISIFYTKIFINLHCILFSNIAKNEMDDIFLMWFVLLLCLPIGQNIRNLNRFWRFLNVRIDQEIYRCQGWSQLPVLLSVRSYVKSFTFSEYSIQTESMK